MVESIVGSVKAQSGQLLTGLVAAPFTPMHEDGSLNLATVKRQVEGLVAGGVTGAFVCGTTGESVSLTVPERKQVAARWQAEAGGRLAVIVHVGHTCLKDAQELAGHAQQIGAFAIGAMAPVYFRPASVEDLVGYCAELAAAAPELPFYYYHIPSMTGVSFDMVDFLRAGEKRIPTLAGVKFTYENLMDFGQCVELGNGRFNMLFGRDEILLAGLALGARGAVGSTYNFAAPIYRRIISAFDAGDLVTAQREQARAASIVAAFAKYNGLAAQKAIMKMIGIDCGPVRRPLRSLDDREYAALRAELAELGLFSLS
jgi:N-acetylneuraminate lyase